MKKFWQLRGDEIVQDLHGIDLLKEYQRLVDYGEVGQFLDYDTTLVIAYRDQLENEKEILGSKELDLLSEVDKTFRYKVTACLNADMARIAKGDPAADYIKAVHTDLRSYGQKEPSSRWWYHLLDR